MSRALVVEVLPGLRKFRRGEWTVFTADGENTAQFQQALREHVLAELGHVAVHLRSMKNLSSSLIGLLMLLLKDLRRLGRRFSLLNPGPRTRDLILIMRLDQDLPIHTSVDDLPPETLGIEFVGEGSLLAGLSCCRAGGVRVLSLEGVASAASMDRIRRELESDPNPIALHVGASEGIDSTFVQMLLSLEKSRKESGLGLPLLNPSIQLHSRLRKEGFEQRLTIFTSLEQVGAWGRR